MTPQKKSLEGKGEKEKKKKKKAHMGRPREKVKSRASANKTKAWTGLGVAGPQETKKARRKWTFGETNHKAGRLGWGRGNRKGNEANLGQNKKPYIRPVRDETREEWGGSRKGGDLRGKKKKKTKESGGNTTLGSGAVRFKTKRGVTKEGVTVKTFFVNLQKIGNRRRKEIAGKP